MWAKTTKYRPDTITPTVKTTELSDVTSAPSRNVKPTAVISAPKRLLGRRHQANKPVPMNDHVIRSPIAMPSPAISVWSDDATSALAAALATTPANATLHSARRSPFKEAPAGD